MPTVPQILHFRQRRREKTQNTPASRAGLGCATLFSLCTAIAFIGLTLFYTALTRDLPSLETIPLLLEPPNGLLLHPTRFYDRSGEHVILSLQNPAVTERRYIPIDDNLENTAAGQHLSPELVTATIATSDPTFWSNPGFSMQGLRQMAHNTLAQRLVSDLLLGDEIPDLRRALRERLLAAQITSHYGRAKVMEWYLNSTYYGNMAYGADAAAQVYFGKSAAELNLAEAAVLAAVAESPASNPLDAPQIALERQHIVIDALLGQGLITVDEAIEARETEVVFREAAPPALNPAPAFTNLVWEQLTPHISLERLERGGFEIITTLDYDLQFQASCAAEAHLARLKGEPSPDTFDGTPCEAALLLPTLAFDADISFDGLATNVVVLDPSTGQILALVGDPAPGLDPAHLPGHPPGSLLTPFAYLTAFTRGFGPASLVWDIPTRLLDATTTAANPHGQFQGPVRLRDALANDYLIPAIQTINQIGAENVWRTAQQLGLTSLEAPAGSSPDGCPGCQLLGGGEITLLEAAQAFGVFANQGMLAGRPTETSADGGLQSLHPIAVLGVSDLDGQVWVAEQAAQTRPVISTQLAYLITHVLSDEAARWPSLGHPNPLEIGRPAGAKMGQTSDGGDIWTVGYTPQLVVGVWMGSPDSPDGGALPPKAAAALWHAILQYAARDLPSAVWDLPPGITTLEVCDPSGMLPTEYCPATVSEVFLTGLEPTQPDTLYQAYQINRETGRLATVFTPPGLIDEHVYLNVPPEASEWAAGAGFSTPPETYDVIYTPPILPDAHIMFPQMFAHLNGEVNIRGRAGGESFESYRLQVGQGLNPTGWIVIGEDINSPIDNGILGTWDTTLLNGLYAIQLVVVRDDQRADTATIQVTVDNQPPDLSIPYPVDGQSFAYGIDKFITFRAQASDNLGLAAVEFYLGDRLITAQT
ncbi:MAG: penicillin-binding protein [Chloroflexi bacterium]|nr:penicillin-binding protein [Chloroflexota bacterium]